MKVALLLLLLLLPNPLLGVLPSRSLQDIESQVTCCIAMLSV
jgi:hypothetical protein